MHFDYITDFHKSRENIIGASEISSCIPHPENPLVSLNAWTDENNRLHPETANDLYEKKINGEDYRYSFPAEMGNFLEPKALYEFIKDCISKQKADLFYRGYQLHSLESKLKDDCVNPIPYNNTSFKHNTEAITDYAVAHADLLYIPDKKNYDIINYKGLKIDLNNPFIVEAKSCNYFSLKARTRDKYKGYDLTLKEWQGVPLKVYFQVQFQMLVYNVDVAYVSLIYNTSNKYFWTIKSNKKHQQELQQIAEYMKKCIDTKTPPKQLAMNQKDIVKLYPTIEDDFVEITGEQLHHVIDSAKKYYAAKKQVKVWQAKEQEHKESMAIHLKDVKVAKGIVNGVMVDLCRYKITKSSQRLCGLKAINERDEKEAKRIMNYLKRKKLINKSDESRSAQICIKEKDLEVLE